MEEKKTNFKKINGLLLLGFISFIIGTIIMGVNFDFKYIKFVFGLYFIIVSITNIILYGFLGE